jgi:enoyl-[acyl-carrier-protein] reductase (NADH)
MLKKQVFPRLIEAEEICHVADFFASPKSGSITGQVVHIGMVS